MIALDTNILVYAHRPEHRDHAQAAASLTQLAEGTRHWAIPWPCVHEFLANVTRRNLYVDPSTVPLALDFLRGASQSPSFSGYLAEGQEHLSILADLLKRGSVVGAMVHDARVAAICLAHGVVELWSADRDFLRFPQLHVRNPLVHD